VFERFTDRARKVLVFAQEEAGRLDHDFIGTEHILLGLLREGEGVAAKALASLDVRLEAVRQKVSETVGRGSSPAPGSPPFTPRSKKVLELSLKEAIQLGHKYIGTEHLLLGLVREGEGVAAQVLISLGAGLGLVRERVMEILAAGPATMPSGLGTWSEGGGRRGRWPEASPPFCPYCQGPLARHLRYINLPAAPTDPEDVEVDLILTYCDNCGRYLGSTAPGGPAGQAFL
jgi:ATP-dependent Clp protease ATP-binding subunit ClpC